MVVVFGVRRAQGIARRSTLTPDTAAKALTFRFNRAPLVAARLEMKPTPLRTKSGWKSSANAKPPDSPATELAPDKAGTFELPTFNFMVLA